MDDDYSSEGEQETVSDKAEDQALVLADASHFMPLIVDRSTCNFGEEEASRIIEEKLFEITNI